MGYVKPVSGKREHPVFQGNIAIHRVRPVLGKFPPGASFRRWLAFVTETGYWLDIVSKEKS
ncbi:MAG: hypothetical protein HUJ27_00680 [Rhodobacteraceae bacterium]|nr:hypothetical protein [Paracoccaceae bacterium]